ncbi:MAG: LysM peptidoglycan-binding domain-containing protein [Pseudomonadota bacterium]
MRWPRWTALVAAGLLWIPVLGLSQEGDEEGTGDAIEEAAPADDAAPAEGEATTEGTSVDLGQAPTEYTVQQGDTLWDLCKRFLNNPWYWPKIWSYNPEIENPHWIYPGNRVRFYPGAGALPGEIEPGTEPTEVADEGGDDIDLDTPDTVDEVELFEAPADLPSKLGAAGQQVVPRRRSFVTREELKSSGEIEGSFAEQEMLTLFQRVYIRMSSSAQPGQQYELFRVSREVRHPITGSNLGYVTEVLGAASVEKIDGKISTAVITAAYDPIVRGDKAGPVSADFNPRINEVANTKKLKGYIVDNVLEFSQISGEYYFVFVDQGSKAGVVAGNTFTVLRAGDGLTGRVEDYPDEIIGRLLVVDVRDDVSTAVVLKSNREMYPGDRIEMRTDG